MSDNNTTARPRAADDFDTIRARQRELATKHAAEVAGLCPLSLANGYRFAISECTRTVRRCPETCPHAAEWTGPLCPHLASRTIEWCQKGNGKPDCSSCRSNDSLRSAGPICGVF